jgi:transporter family-2 protein
MRIILTVKHGTMGAMQVLFVILGALVGTMVPVQAGINASLRNFLPHPIYAAIANFVVGLAMLAVACVAMQAQLPSVAGMSKVPWWYWIGGLMGACLVLAGILLSHRLGAATFVACVIVGQLTASVVCDHYGLFGFAVHHANLQRILGIGLLAGGLVLIRTS